MNTPDVKRGCLDCRYRETPTGNQPCKGCERWSRWVEKEKGDNKKNG